MTARPGSYHARKDKVGAMILPLDGPSALRALRVYRRGGQDLPRARIDLPEPDPSPQRRWTEKLVPLDLLALPCAPSAERPLFVLSPTAVGRPQASFVRARVHGTLPEESFVDLRNGLVIPCPELLFLRMATHLSPEAHTLLAYELTGTYSRDPDDPRLGPAVFGVPPVTSIDRIRSYLERYGRRNGSVLCAHNLASARDNAWSPMEAIIALLTLLPPNEQGYGLGEISLNVRHETSEDLVSLGARASRVPDIDIVGSHVGFNYDGSHHLNLEAILESTRTGEDAEKIVRKVREKSRDDILRNRELMAMGRLILPITSADLFAPGGLDAVMLEAALAREEIDGISAASIRHLVESKWYSDTRQQLIW